MTDLFDEKFDLEQMLENVESALDDLDLDYSRYHELTLRRDSLLDQLDALANMN